MKKVLFFSLLTSVIFFSNTLDLNASETSGTITQNPSYAWSENIGWISFTAAEGNVNVTDSSITGYLWTANYGWINLNPGGEYGGVTNDSEGNLGGYAWNALLGPISFDGVTITDEGVFQGIGAGSDSIAGRITFDCDDCSVETDWRPADLRSTPDPVVTSSPGAVVRFLGSFFGVDGNPIFQAKVEEGNIGIPQSKLYNNALSSENIGDNPGSSLNVPVNSEVLNDRTVEAGLQNTNTQDEDYVPDSDNNTPYPSPSPSDRYLFWMWIISTASLFSFFIIIRFYKTKD